MTAFLVRTEQASYQTVVERGLLAHLQTHIEWPVSAVFVVTTEEVWSLHGERLKAGLQASEVPKTLFLPAGEQHKRMASVETLADQLVERGADRRCVVIGFGGGVVTDVAGFLASIYMRGVDLIQVPTTLLAQVDAAIGGKTGVNLASGKNLIGTFYQPRAVLIDPELLATLPSRELRAGLFEVLKCGLIRDRVTYELLSKRSRDVLALEQGLIDELISAAVRIKTEVVAEDEREGDLRRILNFGHTIGHALEAATEYQRLLHGEAVAWGMIGAARLSVLRGLLAEAEAASIEETVQLFGPLPRLTGLAPDNILMRCYKDKKSTRGKLTFVLLRHIGEACIENDVAPELVRQTIDYLLQLAA